MSLMTHPMCRKEASAVARTLAFRNKVRVQIALDDFCYRIFRGLIDDDDWPPRDATAFVTDLRRFIETTISEIETFSMPMGGALNG